MMEKNKTFVRQPSKWTVVNGQFRFESEGGNNPEKTKRREENNYKSQ